MIQKTSSRKDQTVKVTFELPAGAAKKSIAVVGDFNGWNASKDKMKMDKKKGSWSKTLTLQAGKEYQFRYFVDGAQWRNDEQPDRRVPNAYGTENDILVA